VIGRELAPQLVRQIAHALDPARLIREALAVTEHDATEAFALALGKTAIGMACGVGPVQRGVCLATRDDPNTLPAGWQRVVLLPPWTDEVAHYARDLMVDLVAAAGAEDQLLFVVANGADGLLGPELADGKLLEMALPPVYMLVMSDGTDDPTLPFRECDTVAWVLHPLGAREPVREELDELGLQAVELEGLDGGIDEIFEHIEVALFDAEPLAIMRVFWGVCQLHGRHHELALRLARYLENGPWAAIVLGTEGAPGAYVTPETMAAIRTAGLDPEVDDPTKIFEAISAIAIAPSTGMDHGDLVLVG
jgi:glycerate-2-kinase